MPSGVNRAAVWDNAMHTKTRNFSFTNSRRRGDPKEIQE
ncbi:hypothetical protein X737_31595 [Mesorhizobium sp. L48C026A00]|nr:hypothetical protein X737_31595 [Mesorhizobium sp. L48C026A00]